MSNHELVVTWPAYFGAIRESEEAQSRSEFDQELDAMDRGEVSTRIPKTQRGMP